MNLYNQGQSKNKKIFFWATLFLFASLNWMFPLAYKYVRMHVWYPFLKNTNLKIIFSHCSFFICIFPGDNGRIEYSITSGDDNDDFEIATNGTIRTKRELDRETKNSYNLVVTAKDCAKEPEQKRLSSTVQVCYVKLCNLSLHT